MNFTATAQGNGGKSQTAVVLWCSEHGTEGVGTQQGTEPPGWAGAQQGMGHHVPQAVTLSLTVQYEVSS